MRIRFWGTRGSLPVALTSADIRRKIEAAGLGCEHHIGAPHRVVEPAELMDAAIALAQEVLEGAPLSVKAGRETVMLATEMGRSAALQAGRAAHETAYNSDDAQEGPLAFSQKRKPEWQGR